jgi:dipeptidyl-peptidase-4
MGLPAGNPFGYDESNPVRFVGGYRGGLMLAHGTSDDNCHVSNTLQMAFALESAQKPFSMMLYPRETHGVGGKERRIITQSAL